MARDTLQCQGQSTGPGIFYRPWTLQGQGFSTGAGTLHRTRDATWQGTLHTARDTLQGQGCSTEPGTIYRARDTLQGQEYFLVAIMFRPALWINSCNMQWVSKLKWPQSEPNEMSFLPKTLRMRGALPPHFPRILWQCASEQVALRLSCSKSQRPKFFCWYVKIFFFSPWLTTLFPSYLDFFSPSAFQFIYFFLNLFLTRFVCLFLVFSSHFQLKPVSNFPQHFRLISRP